MAKKLADPAAPKKTRAPRKPKASAPPANEQVPPKVAAIGGSAIGSTGSPDPKVAVLKKHMDLSECEEAVGKLKEFVTAHKDETHRELSMAIQNLDHKINSVASAIKNAKHVLEAVAKQNEKSENARAQA